MLLSELVEITMLRSGQFIVGPFENVQLDYTRFWNFVKVCLKEYAQDRPHTKYLNIEIPDGGYEFVDEGEGVPYWISSVVPIGGASSGSSGGSGGSGQGLAILSAQSVIMLGGGGGSSPLGGSTSGPTEYLWKYRKPILHCVSGNAEVTAHYHYAYDETIGADGIEEVDIYHIDEDDELFIELVVADFLSVVGRSRRAFTLNDLPITMDASDMVSEGQEMRQNVKERLRDEGVWWRAIG